jgi:hypothetical protein
MAKSNLFRGMLITVGDPGAITNSTSKSLVIDFVSAPGEALGLEVRAPNGESHVYYFSGTLSPIIDRSGKRVSSITQLTKIIVRPREKLLLASGASPELTGHYE